MKERITDKQRTTIEKHAVKRRAGAKRQAPPSLTEHGFLKVQDHRIGMRLPFTASIYLCIHHSHNAAPRLEERVQWMRSALGISCPVEQMDCTVHRSKISLVCSKDESRTNILHPYWAVLDPRRTPTTATDHQPKTRSPQPLYLSNCMNGNHVAKVEKQNERLTVHADAIQWLWDAIPM